MHTPPGKVHAIAADMWHVSESGPVLSNEAPQPALSIEQREGPKILAVQRQQIERGIDGGASPCHERGKVWPSVRVETDDLAVEDRCTTAECVGDVPSKLGEAGEPVPALAVHGGLALADVDDATEAVELHLVDVRPVTRRDGYPDGRDWLNGCRVDHGR